MPRIRQFSPKNESQKRLADAVDMNPISFAIGPAGTGKTHAAVGIGVALHKAKYIHQIVISRPAVGAGESNGFLPGTLEEKLAPYMIPIHECLGAVGGDTYKNASFIELASFEYMRGRTFNDAFIIVDEAQNATFTQLQMVLTRIGEGSKMVVTGDLTQSDLPNSGLPIILEMLKHSPDFPIINFTEDDNLRHPIVAKLTQLFKSYKR